MTTFKEFLVETAVKQNPKYRRLSMEEALKLLKTKCKKSLWMVEENKPIYRGEAKIRTISGEANSYTVDTSATERMSTNTNNIYTEIFDSHPKMKSFPKRSRSFIASTSKSKAFEFANRDGLFSIVPFDTAKIGVVGKRDIWDVGKKVEIFNREFDALSESNRMLEELLKKVGISRFNLSGLQKFGEMLKNPKSKSRKVLADAIDNPHTFSRGSIIDTSMSDDEVKEMVESISKDFMKYIYDCYDPSVTGFSKGLENLRKYKDSEVWVGGNVLMFDPKAWLLLRKEFGVA